MVAIPQYRAKKIDSDESVEGFFLPHEKANVIIVNHNARQMWAHRKSKTSYTNIDKLEYYEIDPSTLAIHFPDMIDSEGTKIFASLSEDGKGGDNLVYPKWVGWGEPQNIIRASFTNKGMSLKTKDEYSFHWTYQDIKVTGIQE